MITNQIYIGSATCIEKRVKHHLLMLRRDKHQNPYLQNAWKAYGASAFDVRALAICARSELLFYEQLCIDGFCAHYSQGGYNLCRQAYNTIGRSASARQREVTRQRQIGVPNSELSARLKTPAYQEASRRKLNSFRNDPVIENKRIAAIRSTWSNATVREHHGIYSRGIKRSPETRKKMSAAAIAREAKHKRDGIVRSRDINGKWAAKTLSETQVPGGGGGGSNSALGALLGGPPAGNA